MSYIEGWKGIHIVHEEEKEPRKIYVHVVINVNINSSYCISNVHIAKEKSNSPSSLHAAFAGTEFYWENNLLRHCHTDTHEHKNVFTTVQKVMVGHFVLCFFQKSLREVHWVAPTPFSCSCAANNLQKFTVIVAMFISVALSKENTNLVKVCKK